MYTTFIQNTCGRVYSIYTHIFSLTIVVVAFFHSFRCVMDAIKHMNYDYDIKVSRVHTFAVLKRNILRLLCAFCINGFYVS